MGKLHSYDEDISFYHIDEHAKKAQKHFFQSLDDLVSYLSEGIQQETNHREILLTRGFLVWYVVAASEDFMFISEELKSFEIIGMFHSFCQSAGIVSKMISGSVKGSSDDAFAREFFPHDWNAFKANNTWHLVDSYWCVSGVVGYNAGGVVALESDGNTGITKVEFCAGQTVYRFKEEWFCTNPNIFIYRHFPDDPTWQLLSTTQDSVEPMSLEIWSDIPYLLANFFEHGLRLLSEESVRLKSINGKTTIMLMGKDVEKYSFPYNLFLKESDASTINPSDLPRLVFPGRDGNIIFKFEIRFPVEGTYFINIMLHNIQSKTTEMCAQFMIECDEGDPNCRKLPVDAGIMGFGYGPVAEEAGLKKPPVKGSKLVLKSESEIDDENETDVQKINFKLDVDAIDEYEFVSDMFEEENQEQVTTVVNTLKRQLEIIPPVRPDNEYALVLFHRRKHAEETFKPVLYYMVTTDEEVMDESQALALRKKKAILHEEKKQEKMEKNFNLKERLRKIKEAIDSQSMKGSQLQEPEERVKGADSLEREGSKAEESEELLKGSESVDTEDW